MTDRTKNGLMASILILQSQIVIAREFSKSITSVNEWTSNKDIKDVSEKSYDAARVKVRELMSLNTTDQLLSVCVYAAMEYYLNNLMLPVALASTSGKVDFLNEIIDGIEKNIQVNEELLSKCQ